MKDVFIADCLRLPVGKKNGLYKAIIPEKFTAYLLEALFDKIPLLKNLTESLVLSTAVGTGGNMARYIGLLAGLPAHVPAFTIDAQCVGSYQALILGTNAIKSGEADVVIVGGFESNSLIPERHYHQHDGRRTTTPYFYANFAPERFGDVSLAKTAEIATKKYGFSKEDVVDWAILSNQRAAETKLHGTLSQILCDFEGNFSDENFKSTAVLQRFKQSPDLIDAATSCRLDDGASLIVLASHEGLDKLELVSSFKINSGVSVGGDPKITAEVFIEAVKICCNKSNKVANDIDFFEINESFAIKPLLFQKRFKVTEDKVNLLGGNLAYGHPFGASGAINLMHLLCSLKISQKEFGVVAASAAGGLGSAIMLQQV